MRFSGYSALHGVTSNFLKNLIVYKKTDKWYMEWQQVTTNDNEW